MTDEFAQVLIDDGVAKIVLDHPTTRNVLSPPMVEAIDAALDQIADETPRCLVLEANGDHFCAGGDIEGAIQCAAGDISRAQALDRFEQLNALVERIYTWPSPTVALVDGAAFGAGAALAIACDVVLASEAGRFSFGFRRLGLSIGAGTSALLSTAGSEKIALELIYTGELIDAERAREIGLVNHVYPKNEFEAQVALVVQTIANGPTRALASSKRLLRQARGTSLDDAFDNEEAARETLLDTDDFREGAAAFVERRDPDFDGS